MQSLGLDHDLVRILDIIDFDDRTSQNRFQMFYEQIRINIEHFDINNSSLKTITMYDIITPNVLH